MTSCTENSPGHGDKHLDKSIKCSREPQQQPAGRGRLQAARSPHLIASDVDIDFSSQALEATGRASNRTRDGCCCCCCYCRVFCLTAKGTCSPQDRSLGMAPAAHVWEGARSLPLGCGCQRTALTSQENLSQLPNQAQPPASPCPDTAPPPVQATVMSQAILAP